VVNLDRLFPSNLANLFSMKILKLDIHKQILVEFSIIGSFVSVKIKNYISIVLLFYTLTLK